MNWAVEELATINLGDKRLNERAITLATKLSQQSTESIPKACGKKPKPLIGFLLTKA